MVFENLQDKTKALLQGREESNTNPELFQKELVTDLVKMKKELFDSNDNKVNETFHFSIDNINPDLKTFNEITKKLESDGFVIKLIEATEDIDAHLNYIFCADIKVEHPKYKGIQLKDMLNNSLDRQLIDLGFSTAFINHHIAKSKPNYEDIVNGIRAEDTIMKINKLGYNSDKTKDLDTKKEKNYNKR